MNKIDWVRKLTSRKFWLAVCTFVGGMILAFGGTESSEQTVCGCIMSGAAVLAYIIGEGLTDAASLHTPDLETTVTITPETDETEENK